MPSNAVARKLQLLTLAACALGAAPADAVSRVGAGTGVTAMPPDMPTKFAVAMATPFGVIAAAGLMRRAEAETALILGTVAAGIALWLWWDMPASNTERALVVVGCGAIQWSIAFTAVTVAAFGPSKLAKAPPESPPSATARVGPADYFNI